MKYILILVIFVVYGACRTSNDSVYEQQWHWVSDSIKQKSDKGQFLQQAELGHYLFFDQKLSINRTKSCASCHNPNLYFTDGYKQALGVYADIQLRNTPSILNSSFSTTLNWANHITSFEQQMKQPLFGAVHPEMGMNERDTTQAHAILSPYQHFPIAQINTNQNWSFIIQCISNYMRLLCSRNSMYDAFLRSGDSSILSTQQLAGMQLFFSSRMKCGTCHGGIDFNTPIDKQDRFANTYLYSLKEYETKIDKGLIINTRNQERIGNFRVAGLRNVVKTAPYMHDGSLANLNEVIAHYAKLNTPHPLLKGFSITETEKNQLISFLETLTDTSCLTQKIFQNPFKRHQQ